MHAPSYALARNIFLEVLNAPNGDYSPLKHTVNVPPMQKLTIEF